MITPPLRLACIRKIVDGLVALDAELARLAALDPASEDYDADHLPPRVSSKRSFNRRCRGGIPGARKEAGRWVVARTAWHAAMAEKRERRALAPGEPEASDGVDRLIEDAGYRFTRPDPKRRAGR